MRLGDLDALLKEVRENKELYEREKVYLEGLLLNAPTVEPEKAKESEIIKAYTKGFDTGVETVKNGRPQGEWIFHKDYNESCRYGCNQCGNLNNTPGNFCPNCGARMQKGGAK